MARTVMPHLRHLRSNRCGVDLELAELCRQRLPSGTGLISTVHDELIALAPADAAAQVKAIVESSMIQAMSALFPAVSVEAVCAVCQNWGEKK